MTLIVHPNIRLNSRGDATDALLIRAGKVAARGDDARRLAGAEDRVVRPDAACLMPALIEAHAHPWGLGQRAGVCDLRGARSSAEVLGRLARHPGAPTSAPWVLGEGLDDNLWAAGDVLTAEALDRLLPGVPIFLRRIDYHAAWVSGEALVRAQITPGWTPPGGGRAEVDEAGRLTGFLVDDAMDPVLALIPAATLDDARLLLEAHARLYRALGVATVHNAYVSVAEHRALAPRADARPCLRLYNMIDGTDAALGELLEAGPERDVRWAGCAVKFFADGAMGSRGALLWEPYDDGTLGLEVTPAQVLLSRVPALLEAGWQVCVHAIGDRAAAQVLDAYEAASSSVRQATRPRLEHCQMMTHADIARMARLSVIASVQPIHMSSDSPWAVGYVGEARRERLFAYETMRRAGCVLAGGSDYPIDDPSPWHGLHAACTRINRAGGVFGAGEALARRDALRMYLEGAAWAGFMEGRLGALEMGCEAEVIGVDVDPWACEADALREVRVVWGLGEVMGQLEG
jgi:predicted amidohydrolase YtcJ